MNLEAGAILNHYKIIGHIGAGGMGEVYRSRDERLGRDVAIKLLPSEFAKNADRLRRFEQEPAPLPRSITRISSPSTISVNTKARLLSFPSCSTVKNCAHK